MYLYYVWPARKKVFWWIEEWPFHIGHSAAIQEMQSPFLALSISSQRDWGPGFLQYLIWCNCELLPKNRTVLHFAPAVCSHSFPSVTSRDRVAFRWLHPACCMCNAESVCTGLLCWTDSPCGQLWTISNAGRRARTSNEWEQDPLFPQQLAVIQDSVVWSHTVSRSLGQVHPYLLLGMVLLCLWRFGDTGRAGACVPESLSTSLRWFLLVKQEYWLL